MRYKIKLFLLRCLFLCTLVVSVLAFSVLVWDSSDTGSKVDLEYDYEDVQLKITVASGPRPPVFDAEELRSINSDFRAWLQIPETDISYPVVQGTDNSFYLKHSFSKEYSSFGCLFLDYRTTAADRSLVIHGHNMGLNRDEMFSSLVDFQDQAFAEEHTTIFYSDPEKPGEERYTLFAVLNQDIRDNSIFNYRQQQFVDDEEFQAFVSFLQERSIYSGNYTPTGDIIILSTCNNAYGENNRLLICAGREKNVNN